MTAEQKVALVTGASRGIGAAIADNLGAEGIVVVGTATTEAGAEKISQRFADNNIVGRGMVLNVTDADSINDVLTAIGEEFGAPTILVNNAGITKDNILMRMKEDEWMDVGAWVYKNFDEVSGISFLPFSDHTYAQAPYQDIEREEYLELSQRMPKSIDWSKLADYEKEDTTSGGRELACTADACEMVDIQAS